MDWLKGGALPAKRIEDVAAAPVSPRRKGIRRAAQLMFFSGALSLLFLVISLAIEEPAPMIFPAVVFFVALVWMLYARLFSDNTATVNSPLNHISAIHTPVVQSLGAETTRNALPPAAITSMPTHGKQRVKTNELAQPPSVTDHTTRLLDE
jgi:hypothetical protein